MIAVNTDTMHRSVLLQEVLEYLQPQAGKRYIDGTYGRGGYTKAILDAGGIVYGIDCDPEAYAYGVTMQEQYKNQFFMIKGNFADFAQIMHDLNIEKIDGIVLDLGVSSPQLDIPERGFSFRFDGPLDMRMRQSGQTAADVVNTYSAEALADIIYYYGDERRSRRVASIILEQRKIAPITTTFQLADLVRRVVRKERHGFDPATRTFQALRIYVNQELAQLEQFLDCFGNHLTDGGRLVIVSFHSLEDRIVKHFFKKASGHAASANRYTPFIQPNEAVHFKLLTKKGVRAGDDEVNENPRARSAVLRSISKLAPDLRGYDD